MSWDLVRKGGLSTSSHEARTKLRQIEKLNVKAPGERMVVKSVTSSEVDYRELYGILVIISFCLLVIFTVYQLHNFSLSTLFNR